MQITLEHLVSKTSRTLSFSAGVLGKKIKHTFMTGYVLCRYADTIADTTTLTEDKKIYWVGQFPHIVAAQHDHDINSLVFAMGECKGCSEEEKLLVNNLKICLKEFNNLNKSNKELVLNIVRKVCDGMLFDLHTFNGGILKTVQTKEELEEYCDCMGGAPGVFWSNLILQESGVDVPIQTFISYGRGIGNALQIVNILRDQPVDIENNRCYLPQTQLEAHKITTADLRNPLKFPLLRPLVQEWILWGKKHLKHSVKFFKAIPKSNWKSRASVAWPIIWTLDSLILLKNAENLLDKNKKVKIKKASIYLTLLKTPLWLISNRLFKRSVKKRLDIIDLPQI